MRQKPSETSGSATLGKLIHKRDNVTSEPFFLNTESKDRYRRIAGGIAWPGVNKDAALVLITEDLFKTYETGKRHYRLLSEDYAPDVKSLIDKATGLQIEFTRADWFGDTASPFMRFVLDANIDLYKHKHPPIIVVKPPALDSQNRTELYYQTFTMLTKTQKTMHLGNGSRVAKEFMAGPKIDTINDGLFPGITALFFAMAGLELQNTKRDAKDFF